jgi:hypothetical protein
MKIRILTAVLGLAVMFIFTNCEKESSCELLGNCDVEQLIDPANAANPFDEIGERHNEGLAFLRRNHQPEIDAMIAASPTEGERYIFARSAEFAGGTPPLYRLLRERLGLESDQLLSDFNFTEFGKIFDMLELDAETREALNNSIAAVMRIEPGTVEAANEIINAIKEQERAILDREDLPNRDFALVFMSVWRHSNHYWQKGDGEGAQTRAKWWQIVAADAICGGIGFLLGGPAGGVGLGVGASKAVADSVK